MDARKVGLVAGFELAEALRSRLVAFVLVLYGAGAAIGAWAFMQALAGAERLARETLTRNLGVPESELAEDLVRKQALPGLISSMVSDSALREELLRMDPLAIFYGFMALSLVATLVLVTSASAHAADLASGAARFVLPRCDRTTWALGKAVGQAALLGIGLLAGALAATAVAASAAGFDPKTLLGVLRTSLWAWIYGVCYLGIFSGLSLIAGQPGRARTLCLVTLIGLWLGHKLVRANPLSAGAAADALVWLFPGQYAPLLWSPHAGEFLLAVLGLFAIGLAWFALGVWAFARRDA